MSYTLNEHQRGNKKACLATSHLGIKNLFTDSYIKD